ncbi:MAG: hypothetical protein J0M23_05005 [Rickettsiales bacterium]|nr:hypothetical protein [Rickettsiales bacterium]
MKQINSLFATGPEFSRREPQKFPLSAEIKEDSNYASIIYSSIDTGNIEMIKDNLILDAINQDLRTEIIIMYNIESSGLGDNFFLSGRRIIGKRLQIRYR